MYLSIQEMKNNEIITTGIRVEESMTIRGLRLRLFKYGAPDGDLTLTLKDGATTIGSINITMAALDADVGTYFHGYVLFEGDNAGFRINVDPTTAYKELDIELTLANHTDSATNYISWCKNFDTSFVDSYGSIISEGSQTAEQLTHFQPFGVEIFRNS